MGVITGTPGKFAIAYCSPDECEFLDIGSHIMAKAVVEGSTFCAFFDKGPCSIESVKRCYPIMLHNIYPNDESPEEDEEQEQLDSQEKAFLVAATEIKKKFNGGNEPQAAEYYSLEIMEALHGMLDIEEDETKDSIRKSYSTLEILNAVATYEGLGRRAADMILGWIKDIYGIDLKETGDYIA